MSSTVLSEAQSLEKSPDVDSLRLDELTMDPGELNDPVIDKLREDTRNRTGKDPTWWQLQAAQTVIQRRDCVVSAGTGSGKTLPFVMPLFYDDGLVAVILSPLTALANEQVDNLVFSQLS